MEKYKIGQQIIFKPHDAETFGGRVKKVKDGDEGVVRADGFVKYLTGEARGMIAGTDFKVNGYDTENIAKLVYDHLDKRYDLSQFLEDYDIEEQDFISDIEEAIDEVL